MEILTFAIEGHREQTDVAPATIVSMNSQADEISSALEREIRRLMPPGSGITVQADMSFRAGSIILEGSVVLLSWAGRTALEPVRDELANLIRTVTRRILTKMLAGFGVGPMTVDVAVVPSARSDVTSTSASSPSTAPSAALDVGRPTASASQSGRPPQEQWWFLAFVGLLAVLVLILLTERLLSSSDLRHTVILQSPYVAAAPQTPSSATPPPR